MLLLFQSTVEGSHTLIIANVHVSDSDCYKCEAINDIGSVTTSAHVVVHGNISVLSTEHTYTIMPHWLMSLKLMKVCCSILYVCCIAT